MTGTIKVFINNGYGWIDGDDGNEYYFFHKEFACPKKWFKKKSRVEFEPVSEERGLRAHNITTTKPEPKIKEYSVYGKWVKVNKRIRCSECNCTTELKNLQHCPHCGVAMELKGKESPPDNEVNRIKGRNNENSDIRWIEISYGFRCQKCKLVTPWPTKFCPHCGSYMQKYPLTIEDKERIKDYAKRWL